MCQDVDQPGKASFTAREVLLPLFNLSFSSFRQYKFPVFLRLFPGGVNLDISGERAALSVGSRGL